MPPTQTRREICTGRLPVALFLLGAALRLTALVSNASVGIITTIAGGGGSCTITNGMPATNSLLCGVEGLTTNLPGNLYLAHDSGAAVRRVNATNGLLYTVAGNGSYGTIDDGGEAMGAGLSTPGSVAVDLTGNICICDVAGHFSTWGVVLAQAGPPPVHLQSSALGKGSLRLSWTGSVSGVLEISTNLAPDSGLPAGAPTQQSDGSWQSEVAPTEPARFYRLQAP